jgi:hypothetical protein
MGGLLGVDPALLGTSAAVEAAGAGTMAGAAGGAAPEITMIVGPGLDGASLALAAGFNARGLATDAMMTELTTYRSLFSDTVAMNGVGYAGVDVASKALIT